MMDFLQSLDPILVVVGLFAAFSSAMVVTRRNPIYSAVWMLLAFLSVAVVFLRLSAPFLAAIHVLVYTGAILVLLLFVIMLLNLREDELGDEYPAWVRIACAVGCGGLFAAIAVPVMRAPELIPMPPEPADDFGSVSQVGLILFNDFGLPFELVSLLIVVAMFGAMVLAKKKLWA